MAKNVEIYTRHCQRLREHADLHGIEAEVSLAALNPPCAMYGTCDFYAFFADRNELHVVDFKYGSGAWVNAKGNLQLQYYAVATMLLIRAPVETAVLTIIQPRFQNGDPIRSAVVSFEELTEFSMNLMDRARAALASDAPRVAGRHCQFCAVKPTCLAHQQSKATTASKLFSQFALEPAES